jgi:tetratricopeptide (TPR) repeat protein
MADVLRKPSAGGSGERSARAAAGALVLRCVERAWNGDLDEFSRRRAAAEVERLAHAPERSLLLRLSMTLDGGSFVPGRVTQALVGYACELERTRRLEEAAAAIALALAVDGANPATTLHAARVARGLGQRERALALYAAARDLDGSGTISRLAEVGEALVSDDPVRAIGRAIRGAIAAGDHEAAAVGLEERASARRRLGDRRGAARDLAFAGARFPAAVDRARVAHELAGVALAVGDAAAAREALRLALACGEPAQRSHARARLHTLSRDLGDQLGMRRWRSFERPTLVSFSAYRPAEVPLNPRRLVRWRELLESPAEPLAG